MQPTRVARAYYAALDDEDYERLAALLEEGFVQHRPDRTLAGRERFVRFMREERPATDTTHAIEGVYADDRGAAAEGRLVGADDSPITGFVDVFSIDGDRIVELRTYTAPVPSG